MATYEEDVQAVTDALARFKECVADVRGRRGRDLIRKMKQGRLIDAIDAGMERMHPSDFRELVDEFKDWRARNR